VFYLLGKRRVIWSVVHGEKLTNVPNLLGLVVILPEFRK